MTKDKIRFSLITLGILDIVSFYRTYETGLYMWDDIRATLEYGFDSETEFWDNVLRLGIPLLSVTLVLLIFTSGLLLIMGKKAGIIIYYFEFPLRLMFLTLTFGFILKIFDLQINTWTYKMTLTFIAGLELLRLIYSIWTQRNYFRVGQTASP